VCNFFATVIQFLQERLFTEITAMHKHDKELEQQLHTADTRLEQLKQQQQDLNEEMETCKAEVHHCSQSYS